MTLKKNITGLVMFVLIIIFWAPFVLKDDIAADESKSFFWKVRSETATAYILGSIHFAKPEFYPMKANIENAFNSSSILVVEVNVTAADNPKMQETVMSKGIYRGEETIKDNIDSELNRLLDDYLKKNNIPVETILKLKPGMLALTISAAQFMNLGYFPEHGIDLYFLNRSQHIKPILELESMDEQLSMIFDMPNENLFLKYTLVDLSKIETILDDMFTFWEKGDLVAMDNLLLKPYANDPEFQPILKIFFYDRNIKMTSKIKDYLKTDKTYFIVIGAGHMVGEKGIINLLNNGQYEVTQL